MSRLFRALLLLAVLACAPLAIATTPPPPQFPPEYVQAVRSAITAFSDRDFPKTIEALDAADALLPPTPLTLNTRGAVKIEQGKHEEGTELCTRALELDPKFYPARFNLCEVLLVQKRYADARTAFQVLLDEFPKDELVMYRILLTHLMEKNETAARQMLTRIPFPGQTAAYYYGNAAWEFAQGNAEEAHKWVKRGNWVFNARMTVNFSDPLREIGWLKEDPGTTDVLPDLVQKPIGGATKLELAQPESAAPFLPPAAPVVPRP